MMILLLLQTGKPSSMSLPLPSRCYVPQSIESIVTHWLADVANINSRVEKANAETIKSTNAYNSWYCTHSSSPQSNSTSSVSSSCIEYPNSYG